MSQGSCEASPGEDSLRRYLAEIGRRPLLDREDEQRLGRLIEEGREAAVARQRCGELPPAQLEELQAKIDEGEEATRTFIEANLRLVVSIAKRYQTSGLPLLDLIQEGNLGLLHALEKFDASRGFKFSTYATWWIHQAISRAIANTARVVRLPAHAGETVKKVQRARASLEAELGRSPRLEELVSETHLAPTRVDEALQWGHHPVSIFDPLAADGDMTLADVIQDPDANPALDTLIAASLPAQVQDLLAILSEREREIVCLRYGLDRGRPRSLTEVGQVCGLTREGVRYVESRALEKLRRRLSSTSLADLLAG
jgi:RNA polymerase sigma factor (sigma-70 family)